MKKNILSYQKTIIMTTFKYKLTCYLLALSFTVVGCGQFSESKRSVQTSNVNIEKDKPYLDIQSELNFGKIDKKKQSIKEIELEINNIGEAPLVIMKADVSCGCMTVDYTKQPIKKGEKGFLNVKIKTTNQNGIFNKSIIIKSNAQNNIEIIRIKGHIQ